MIFAKGKTIQIQSTIDENTSAWKIRAVLHDVSGHSIKLATANSGGSNNEIEKTVEGAKSIFIIKVPSGVTTDWDDKVTLEIEADTGEMVGGKPEIVPLYNDDFELEPTEINWTDPDA